MTPAERFPLGAEVSVAALESDPHPVLARLRADEPVSWVPVLGGWLVSRRDLVLQVMRDADTFTVDDPRFSTARVVGPSMLSLDGAEHTRHRQPFDRAFGLAEARARFTAFVEAETDRLVGAIERRGSAEIRRALAGPLAVAVVAEALGLAETDAPTVLSWYDAIVRSVSGVAAGEPVSAAGTDAFNRLRARVEETIAGAVSAPADPPATVSLLAAVAAVAAESGGPAQSGETGEPAVADGPGARGAGGLSVSEVVSNAAVLMFGGIETTEGMITNACWHLLTHPDQLALVRGDPDLLPGAIEESLRLEPAAAVVDRYATRDVEFGGAPVRRGDLVVASLAGANRDPAEFTDPDAFDVRRPNARRHVAFAQGPHVCIGMNVARIEAQVAVRALLERLPGLRCDPDHSDFPRGLVFRKPPSLHVRWDPPA